MKDEITGITGVFLYLPYLIYQVAVFLKNLSFKLGLEKAEKVDALVISIGGITFGGSGKTPATIFLADKCEKSHQAAVISRGYRRTTKGLVLISDGRKIAVSPSESGDELYMIAKRCRSTVVIADEARVEGCRIAVKNYNRNTIILDDCFQHRHIHRDVDVVLLEPEVVFHPARFFLREPFSSIKRADVILILDAHPDDQEKLIGKIRRKTKAKVFFGWRIPQKFHSLVKAKSISDEELKYKKTAAFCALANPKRFAAVLNSLGIYPEGLLAFPDHCPYSPRDIERIAAHFAASGAEILLTTEKDSVKLPPLIKNLPVYYLTIALEINNADDFMDSILEK